MDESGDVITLSIPAVSTFTRLPRVAIVGLATRSGFSYEEVEDLRLAIGEVCQVLLDGDDPDGTIAVRFAVQRGRMDVEVATDAPPGRFDGVGERLAQQLIDATVGKVTVTDDGRRVRFAKVAADD